MKTPAEIKEGLDYCGSILPIITGCATCPYWDCENGCGSDSMLSDASAYIRQLERERDALLEDLRGTDPCDNCKFCGDACKDCEEDEHWEWRGVKED